jgi:hypothetical protein
LGKRTFGKKAKKILYPIYWLNKQKDIALEEIWVIVERVYHIINTISKSGTLLIKLPFKTFFVTFVFNICPRVIIVIALFIDIRIFQRVEYLYKALILLIIQLILNVIIYMTSICYITLEFKGQPNIFRER